MNPKNKGKKGKKADKKRVEVDVHAVQDEDEGVRKNSDSSDDNSSNEESSGNES